MEKKLTKKDKEQIKIVRKEIEKLNKEIDSYGIIGQFVYDWKEVHDNVLKDWKKTVEKLGGHFTFDPTSEGSDAYVFYITKNKLNKNIFKKRDKLEEKLDILMFQ